MHLDSYALRQLLLYIHIQLLYDLSLEYRWGKCMMKYLVGNNQTRTALQREEENDYICISNRHRDIGHVLQGFQSPLKLGTDSIQAIESDDNLPEHSANCQITIERLGPDLARDVSDRLRSTDSSTLTNS